VFDELLIELDGIAVSKGFTFLAAKNGVDLGNFSPIMCFFEVILPNSLLRKLHQKPLSKSFGYFNDFFFFFFFLKPDF
jgi:hypothetical protein